MYCFPILRITEQILKSLVLTSGHTVGNEAQLWLTPDMIPKPGLLTAHQLATKSAAATESNFHQLLSVTLGFPLYGLLFL